eukprot:765814-Hanusia_phi.AAC.4
MVKEMTALHRALLVLVAGHRDDLLPVEPLDHALDGLRAAVVHEVGHADADGGEEHEGVQEGQRAVRAGVGLVGRGHVGVVDAELDHVLDLLQGRAGGLGVVPAGPYGVADLGQAVAAPGHVDRVAGGDRGEGVLGRLRRHAAGGDVLVAPGPGPQRLDVPFHGALLAVEQLEGGVQGREVVPRVHGVGDDGGGEGLVERGLGEGEYGQDDCERVEHDGRPPVELLQHGLEGEHGVDGHLLVILFVQCSPLLVAPPVGLVGPVQGHPGVLRVGVVWFLHDHHDAVGTLLGVGRIGL